MVGHLLPSTPKEIAELVELKRSMNLGFDSAPTKKPKRTSGRLSRRLSKEMAEDIVRRYRSAQPTTKLATDYGVSCSSIASLLRKEGVILRGQPMTKEMIGQAVKLYSKGLTIRQVAKQIGHSYGTVWAALHRSGVQLSGMGGQLR